MNVFGEEANIEAFLKAMGDYAPPIPDSVIMHVISEAGLNTTDPRVHRTLNVACQKFISSVLSECYSVAARRTKADDGQKKSHITLQLSDLKETLAAHDIHVNRPEFIVSIPGMGAHQ